MSGVQSVLIVDDDRHTAQLLTAALEPTGIQLYYASTGQDGIRMARELAPGLILMDLHFPPPSIHGWDAITMLKTDAQLAQIPVLVITAASMDSIRRAIQAGADDYLQKPFALTLLREKVSAFLGTVQH